MIRPILYTDLVALARAHMCDPQNRDLVGAICDHAHTKGWSLEDACTRFPKVEGFSFNSNRGLAAFLRVGADVLIWRRENELP
ncbi:MAG: hypothetical protein AAF198_09060 [Pseudomonadota bacterium]